MKENKDIEKVEENIEKSKNPAEIITEDIRQIIPTAEQGSDLGESKETLKQNQQIIIVCGPPHSGKSVFFGGLKHYLPRKNTRLFRACPDGEGTWSQKADEDVAQNVRRKGSFSQEFMDFTLKGIQNISSKRVLVDVGGIRSKENADIFKLATHAVILCRSDKPEEKSAWEKFARENGLVVLASLDSALTGEESSKMCEDGVVRGQVVGLERGQEISSEAIEVLAEYILKETEEDGEMELVSNINNIYVISLDNLADKLQVPSKGRTIKCPDKGYNLDIELPWWTAEKIKKGIQHIAGLDSESPVLLDGGHPASLYAAITATLSEKELWYTDETNYEEGCGKVETLELSNIPSDTLEWNVEERNDYTLVEVGWKKDVQWTMDTFKQYLSELKLPNTNPDKGVVISGKMAYLLFGSMTRTYQNNAKWVGVFAPQQKEDAKMQWPAMIVYSKTEEKQIGDYIECKNINFI